MEKEIKEKKEVCETYIRTKVERPDFYNLASFLVVVCTRGRWRNIGCESTYIHPCSPDKNHSGDEKRGKTRQDKAR